MFQNIKAPVMVITGTDQHKDRSIIPIVSECNNSSKKLLQISGAHCFLFKYMNYVIKKTLEFFDNIANNK